MSPTPFIVGLDLGQAQDPTALAVVERSQASDGVIYAARHLQRWPLRTAYTEIVRDVTTLLQRPPLRSATAALVVDATGVGAAVMDLFRAESLGADDLVPVTITAGADAQKDEEGGWRVPKRDLVGVVQVLLQNQRLRIAAALPEAETLLRELEGFRVRVSAAGHDTYGAWRDGTHDDLVLAVALACWYGEHEGVGIAFAYIAGRLVDLSEGRVFGRWDAFEERFVRVEGQ